MSKKRNKFLAQYGHDGHIDKLLDSSDGFMRNMATRNPNATKEHMSKALNDSDNGIRQFTQTRLKEFK